MKSALLATVGWLILTVATVCAGEPIVFETATLRYAIAADGRNLRFEDRASGTDYLRPGGRSPVASARLNGADQPATAATLADGRLRLQFGTSGLAVVLRVDSRPTYLRFTVESISGELDALTFLQIPLTLKGKPDEAFGACALSLNLPTRVDQLPALQSELRASGHRKFGLVGAKVAVVGAPVNRMLAVLKDVLAEADEMPPCRVAGPWADEIPFNHGSYLFNFGTLVETNVQEWIDMTRSLGLNQIDNHGGGAGFFRFGDFALNRDKWPEGWATYRRIVDRLHAAGIGSIFHTYAFFLDKQSRYVSPVPDSRLDAFRSFTLARDIGPETREIEVTESTRGLSAITGFFEHNSVVLHVGDELVTFAGVSQEPPWRFTGVKRGALGTRAAAHAAGGRARQLKECFGLFVPDPESSLFEEIAANHAEVVNRGDFDGIYLDAIDGSSILRGPDECWYWADKFVFEIQKRLKRPVGMEMSAMWHHFWQYRTRWQAWDYPRRGHRRFIDLHAQSINGGLLLPLHLGWWNFQSFEPPQVEPTYPEVLEQLGARLIGWDAGISLTGAVDRKRLEDVPLFRRAVDTLRTCEELRRSGLVSAAAKARLREPGSEFALIRDSQGRPGFRRIVSHSHTVSAAEPRTRFWMVANPFGDQPVSFRLEVLMSAGSMDATNAAVLARLDRVEADGWQRSTAAGVEFGVTPAETNAAPITAMLRARNGGPTPRKAAWTRLQRRFDPPLNLKTREALGLWIDGDGRGEVLAIRLESPQHLAFGALADRYVPVDFAGRRFVSLVETESDRWSDFGWNDGKGLYNVYRETIDFGVVESVSVWLQNLPAGEDVRVGLGEIRAVPMLTCTVTNAAVTVNGITLAVPVELSSGSWVECRGDGVGVAFGSKGEELRRLTFGAELPRLRPGANALELACPGADDVSPRVKVTVFCEGEVVNLTDTGPEAERR